MSLKNEIVNEIRGYLFLYRCQDFVTSRHLDEIMAVFCWLKENVGKQDQWLGSDKPKQYITVKHVFLTWPDPTSRFEFALDAIGTDVCRVEYNRVFSTCSFLSWRWRLRCTFYRKLSKQFDLQRVHKWRELITPLMKTGAFPIKKYVI